MGQLYISRGTLTRWGPCQSQRHNVEVPPSYVCNGGGSQRSRQRGEIVGKRRETGRDRVKEIERQKGRDRLREVGGQTGRETEEERQKGERVKESK